MRWQARREGFTLVEVVVALTLLAMVALSVGAATARLSGSAARDERTARAVEIAGARMRQLEADDAYAELESRYAGLDTAGLSGLVRTTTVQRVRAPQPGGGILDFKRLEVQVTGPGLRRPVRLVSVVGAP